MEEILASIRRIISEDEPPAPAEPFEIPAAPAEAARPAPGPTLVHPEPAPPEPAVAHEDILELTDRVPDAASAAVETVGDLDVMPASAAPPPPPSPEGSALLSDPAAAAAAAAFGQLSRTIAMPAEGRTLEDVVRELLRPMLKSWLDEYLPGIVQQVVAEEVERVARRRV